MGRQKRSGFGAYPLEYVALGLLMNESKHGYALYQDFETHFDLIWKAGQAKFYNALARLEEKQYLSFEMDPQENRPARKVYHITPTGKEAFLNWLHQPVLSIQAIRVEWIAKLRFFDLLKADNARQFIDAQIDALQAMLSEWQSADRESSDMIYQLVDDYRYRQVVFIIDWLKTWRTQF